ARSPGGARDSRCEARRPSGTRRDSASNVEDAMTFQLERDETISAGVKRLALEQIDAGLDALARPPEDVDEAIHAVRQALKRVRALLELARGELGEEAYERERACMRDVGRSLGAARDAAVLVETLRRLGHRGLGRLT